MFEIPNFVAAQRKIRPNKHKIPSADTALIFRRSPAAETYLVAAAAAQAPHSSSSSLLVNCKLPPSICRDEVLLRRFCHPGCTCRRFRCRCGLVQSHCHRKSPVARFGACAIWLICATYLHFTVAWSGFRLLRSTYWL